MKKIEIEVLEKMREYLINCKNNYSESVSLAQIQFSDTYNKINDLDYLADEFIFFYNTNQNLKNETEIDFLESLINKDTCYPGVFEKLAKIYSKNKKFTEAHAVCVKWFNGEFWKIPNMATTSLRLLDRFESLEKKILKTQSSS